MDEAGKELVDHHRLHNHQSSSPHGLEAKVEENGETLAIHHHQQHEHHGHQQQHHVGHLQQQHHHHEGGGEQHHHHHGDEEDDEDDDEDEDGDEHHHQQQHHQHQHHHTQQHQHQQQHQLEHHHQPLLHHHQSSAEEVAHHQQQVAELVQQHHQQQQQQQQLGAYAGLTNEQLQAISAANSSGLAQAQAQALQHQIHQHLQQQLQGPFPFAYQTLPPLPPPGSGGVGMSGGNMNAVGMPAHLGNGGGLPSHLVNGGIGIGGGGGVGGGMPSHLQAGNGGSNGGGGGGGVNVGVGNIEDAQQIKARPKRKQVKSACLNCRKRKTGCDSFRPCTKCVRNGLESTCMDVPRKKRSSNRSKTNATVTPLSADSSSSSPSSSPALGAQPSAPAFTSPLSSQLQYMSAVNMPPGMAQGGGIPMPPQSQYTPQLIPMAWANGAQMVSMTWEEITKHVASAQNNSNLALVPPELAWKGNEGVAQHGSMTPAEQSK